MTAVVIPAARILRPDGLTRRLLRHWGFRCGATLALLLVLLAVIGPLLAHGPDITHYDNQLAAPSRQHWLGTDDAGRDEFARTVAGARATLGAAAVVFVLTTVVGVLLGVLSGYAGGVIDMVISRVIDLMLGLPSQILALAVVGALGPTFAHLVLAVTVTGWAGLARLSRSYTLGARGRPDVVAARMAGVRPARLVAGHVLPGVVVQAFIVATVGLGDVVLTIAGMSFLGLGAQPPTSEWGSMLNDSRLYDTAAPWLLIGPSLGIVASVTAATLISDALRDVADPGRS